LATAPGLRPGATQVPASEDSVGLIVDENELPKKPLGATFVQQA
jgi:hypothetical protein